MIKGVEKTLELETRIAELKALKKKGKGKNRMMDEEEEHRMDEGAKKWEKWKLG